MMPTASSQIFEKIFNRFDFVFLLPSLSCLFVVLLSIFRDCSLSKKSLENLKENLRKSFYDR